MAEFDNLRLFLVEDNSQIIAYFPEILETLLQIFLTLVDQVSVIHIATISANSQHLFDIVIHPIRRCQRKRLADL